VFAVEVSESADVGTELDLRGREQFAEVVKHLDGRFGSELDHDTVERTVRSTWAQYSAAKIRNFIPMLVEKDSYDTLRLLAHSRG
jgi:hypothetical protein